MAATTEPAARIERDLDALTAWLADLPDLVSEWSGLSEGERVSLSLDWDHMVEDFLPELRRYYVSGLMLPAQATRYCVMIDSVRSSIPALQRLSFQEPQLPSGC